MEGTEEDSKGPPATGWDAVLLEMARKRGGMGLMSALKKSEKKERLPRTRLAGSGKSSKRMGEDDPEFTDVIDELKYRLERMKRGDDGEGDADGDKKRARSTKKAAKEIIVDLEDLNLPGEQQNPPLVSKVLFPDAPEIEKKRALPRPFFVPTPPPIPSVWPPLHMEVQAAAKQATLSPPDRTVHTSNTVTTSLPFATHGTHVPSASPPPAATAVPSTSVLSSATTVNVSVTKTLPLPYGLFVPMDAAVYPGHIQAAGIQAGGALSLDFRQNLASQIESLIEEEVDGAVPLKNVYIGESSRKHGGAKKSTDDLPIPSSFFGAIQRLQMAHETRDRNREREKQREMRYYDALPPAKAHEPTVPKEFSFASRRRDQQLFTYRKPQEVSCSSLLPNSYYLPNKVLLNSTNQDLSGAFFMSTLRQPADPLPTLCVPPLDASLVSSGKPVKMHREPVERKAKRWEIKMESVKKEAREKKEADLKLQQERDEKKRHEDRRRMALQSAKRRGDIHTKILAKYDLVKPQTVERLKSVRENLCPPVQNPKSLESSHFPVSTVGGHFDLLCDTVPLNIDDYLGKTILGGVGI